MRKNIFTLVLAVIVGIAGVTMAKSPTARAMSPGVHFTSTDSPTWQTNGEVWALTGSNGLVVAGGTFTNLRPPQGTSGSAISANGLAVLDAETGAPTSCRFTLGGSSPTVRALATSDDGATVYVGGNFSSINGASVGRFAAIDPAACTVLPLRVTAVDSFVYAIAVHGNTVYLAGAFNSVDSQPRSKFAAINATTGAVLPFVADADLTGRAVAVSPDGTKVAIGGDITSVNGEYSHSIAVVDAVTGENVHTYGRGFIPATSVTRGIHADDGELFYVANEGTGGGVFDGRLAVNWDTGEQVWRDTCLGATQAVVTYQGTLYSASHAHDCTGNNAFPDGKRSYFLAQSSATAEFYGWYPTSNDGTGEGIGPRSLTIATGSGSGQPFLWYGGMFTTVNGHAQQGLTRFGTTSLTATPTPTIVAEATAEGTIQVRFQTVLDSDDSVLTYSVFRDGSSTPIWTGTAESVWWKRPQVTFVDTGLTPGQRHTYRVRASDGVHTSGLSNQAAATATAPDPDYRSVVRADEPELLWNSTIQGRWVQDSGRATSGVGLPGIATEIPGSSTASPIPGDTTGSLSYNGSTSYLWEDDYRPAPNTYSVEAWFNTTTGRGGKIIGFGNGRPRTNSGATQLSGHYDRNIYMDNSGRLTFGVYVDGTRTLRTQDAYNDGQWHHVVGTQGPSGMAFYVDGVRVGSSQQTTGQDYWGVWHVGGDNLNGWPNRPSSDFFDGLIDEVATYRTALSAQRVAAHYNASGRTADVNPAPTDPLGARTYQLGPELYWRMDETSGNTAVDSSFAGQQDGEYRFLVDLGEESFLDPGSAARFPGNSLGTLSRQGQGSAPSRFTASIWFNTTTDEGGKIFGFEDRQTGNGDNYDRHLYMNDAGRLSFGTWVGSAAIATTNESYNDGEWHHVVGVIDETGTRLYVDGVLRATHANSDTVANEGYWRLGGGNLNGWPNTGSNSYFEGRLDEFAVFNRGLTAAEIQQLYVDDAAPTAPTNLAAVLDARQVELTWTASTDDVGIEAYEVHRGSTADFTPSPDTLVGASDTTSFTVDEGVPGTTWFTVVAIDPGGNRSAASAAVQVVVPDTTAPATPDGVTAELSGTTAQLSWAAATDDVGVVGYQVHRGTTVGFTPGADSLLAQVSSTSYEDADLAIGEYFYKIIAVDAAGNASPPSTPVSANVAAPDTTPPGPVSGLTVVLSGTTAQLSWTAATDDVGISGYQVHRGTTADFTPGTATLVAEPTGTSHDDTGLAPGTYFYRVIAVDTAGNPGPATAAVELVLAAPDTTAPGAPANLSAAVSGSAVALTWPAATDDVGVTSYTVHRGTTSGFTPGAGNQVGTTATTDYTDASVAAETTYYYRVVAHDAAGNASTPSPEADVTTAGAGGEQVVTIGVDEDAMVVSSSAGTNYGSNTQLSSSASSQSFLGFTLPAAPPGTVLQQATLSLRTSGDPSAGSGDAHPVHLTTGAWTEAGITWSNRPTTVGPQLGTITGFTAAHTFYEVGLSAAALQSRLGQQVTMRISPTGSDNLRLWSSEYGGATSRPLLTLVFVPGSTVPDTTPPNAPASLTATVDDTTVQLSWAPASDDVAVAGYRIHRGISAGFTPDAGNQRGAVAAVSFSDGGVAPGTWFYKVVAVDGAGNASAASEAVSATVAEPPPTPPTVVSLTPEADSAAVQTNPNEPYGSFYQLMARNDQQSFLRFTLPEAPAGTTLTQVRLLVRTSGDPAAGTTATVQFDLVDGAWQESTLVWGNRPTTVLAALGTLGGATATNTAYVAGCAVGPIGSRLGESVTVRLSNTTNDNIRIYSKEGPAPYRPTLELTFTPT
ncbi:LamG-like jellyroll fold domain-containing protein [Microlunatus sp. Y2014]|uniref:LamG-like jellyroll fold domain-containing protein n=1 Tax=Microlunatus sp. Y2014 TaxID=3418488 RepID=UPI003DA701AC